jgi:hypothetical protein
LDGIELYSYAWKALNIFIAFSHCYILVDE